MKLTAGIDIGSITTKAAILQDNNLLGTTVSLTGYRPEEAGQRVLNDLLVTLKLQPTDIGRIVATGYGRRSIAIAHHIATEIMCHAVGACFLNPSIRSIIDIGGQDSKAIIMDERGKVVNFAMNDKCAAGTGRFLEVMARALGIDLDEFGTLSVKSQSPSKISSLCTVFAESEVVSLVAKGESRENIVAGLHEAIASRVFAMAKRVGLTPPVMMTGGVARNAGAVRALEKVIEMPVLISPYAQVIGAIGAAAISL